MIGIVVNFRVKDGCNAAFEAGFRAAKVGVVANEPGSLFYHLVKSREDGQVYRVMEAYADEAALQLHMGAGYLEPLRALMKATLAEPPSAAFMDGVA